MDRKTFNKPKQKKGGPKQKFASIPKQVPADTMVLRTSYTIAALSSGTDGTISSSIGASITSTSEYPNLASLYREVKLMAQQIEFFFYYPFVNAGTNNVTTLWYMGTDMRMNATTYTSPSAPLDIYNASDRRLFARTDWKKVLFRRRVPKDLEFTNIADDCPTLPVPFAGSPGVIQILSLGNVVSVAHTTTILVTGTYMLKGRI